MVSSEGLLFIEPRQPAAPTPLIDAVTRRMCAAFRQARNSDYAFGGIHMCFCGAASTCNDYILPSGDVTNSLCVHYLAHHRCEVPPEQLLRIEAFAFGEAQPTELELQGPELLLAGVRSQVERRLGGTRLTIWEAWGLDIDALCLGLRGGCLPHPEGWTRERADAESLLRILEAIAPASLGHVEKAAAAAYGDVQQWGAIALRHLGWQREAWVAPLLALMQHGQGMERRLTAMNFGALGAAAGAAAPILMELAKKELANEVLQYDLSLALRDIGLNIGMSLLD
jgi:hypothetical protein